VKEVWNRRRSRIFWTWCTAW